MKKLTLSLLVLFVAGCITGGQVQKTAGKSTLPKYTEKTLANGLNVLFIHDSTLPRVSLTALIKVGAVSDPSDLRGLNYMTSALLDEGTKTQSSMDFAEHLEYLGARFGIHAGYDFTTLSMQGLSYTRSEMLTSLVEVLRTPSFPEKELKRLKGDLKAQFKRMSDDADSYTDILSAHSIFGESAYGYPEMGKEESVNSINRTSINRYFLKYYRPNNAYFAVAGDFDTAFEKEVEEGLSKWSERKELTDPIQEATQAKSSDKSGHLNLKSKKGLKQTQIRLGFAAIDRLNPDYIKLRAANLILGGAFASRLNQVVRADMGLTYNISSQIDARRFPGPFVISTVTRNDKVAETLNATLKVYNKFVESGVDQKELDAAKSLMIGQFPKTLETLPAIAFNLLVVRFYGVGDKYLTDFVQNVQNLKLTEVNQSIQSHFKSKPLEITVFGDGNVIKSQLEKVSPVTVL